jgi:hypothetical protein
MAGTEVHPFESVEAFLDRPGVLGPHGPDHVEETHAGRVYLAGERAWKIKKPVRLPFLDFTTYDRRRAALARELELNRPHAPDLYLGLSTVTRQPDGSLAIDGEGLPVEAILLMRRFEQDHLFDRMAETGRLTLAQVEGLAPMVRRLHTQAPVVRQPDADCRFQRVAAALLRGMEQVELFGAERPRAWMQALDLGRARRAAVLRDRASRGYVRRCHGDLHLKNIVLWRGAPTAFDALEFDEELATTDVFYDLAFVLMDLLHRGLRAHANALLSAYLAGGAPEELSGLDVLPAFLSVRAAVRASVEAWRARDGRPGDDRTRAEVDAQSYLDAAHRMLEPTVPRLVALGGLSGTGKSTLARRIAPSTEGALGAIVLRTDTERKALANVSLDARLPAEWYTEEARARVYARVLDKARRALRAGWTVVVDATHTRFEDRVAMEAVSAEVGVPFHGLWLDAPPPSLRQRLATRSDDPSDADPLVLERQLHLDLGPITWTRVDAGDGPDTVAKRVAALVHRPAV